ncbi:MAG: acyltransferase family protein [Pleomorphochaeta sp.]
MLKRNEKIDFIRGVAIILVVFGHIISTNTIGFENNFIYKIIWSLQMPLFMIISGYLVNLSKRILTFQELLKCLNKKSNAYLKPWLIWTFINGVYDQEIYFSDEIGFFQSFYIYFKKILFHMDISYWFLFSIWTISIIFYIIQFLNRNRIGYNKFIYEILFIFVSIFLLYLIGKKSNFKILGLKYTLYYIPYYYIGYKSDYIIKNVKLLDILSFSSFIIYFILISSFNFYSVPDDSPLVTLRILASLSGCLLIVNISMKIDFSKVPKLFNKISFIGRYTLEIYVLHYFFIKPFELDFLHNIHNINGVLVVLGIFIVEIISNYICICLINSNKYSKKILFNK